MLMILRVVKKQITLYIDLSATFKRDLKFPSYIL